MKFSFSGHETFACKQHWLKKGIDHLNNRNTFADEHAVISLGVGKNMVNSIKFWLKAFGMIDDRDVPTPLAEFLFGENGVDLYLEDSLTLWLLHYQLIKQNKASIYSLTFNEFRRERNDFTKTHLLNFLERKIAENGDNFSNNTLESDIRVFLSNYVPSNPNDIEEAYTNLLQELNLLSTFTITNSLGQKNEWYRFNVSPKFDLPIEAILFAILDNENYGQSISLSQLAIDHSAPGSVFMLTEISLSEKFKELASIHGIYTETAGNPVLQMKSGLDKWEILQNYYDNN
ncbi:DUF4007 family protein [Dyadobacter frigoris]|uniref:DUF4007 family protein n=1 Tax=Dyadobacter frigoris TaxID=2576211 RepID=A0A4U6DAK6_9BACT|nr:DUF4007 family protein [Dyadobacter frigoris]TKT93337.1 DUF4007 family protein [Dyadobacter frigoris]